MPRRLFLFVGTGQKFIFVLKVANCGEVLKVNHHFRWLVHVAKSKTAISYAALRKECLNAIRQWPGCETVGGILIVRTNNGRFLVRVTLFGETGEKIGHRASAVVQREMQRRFHLIE